MQKGIMRWLVTGLLVVLGLSGSLSAKAADSSKSSSTTPSNEIGFSVSAKIPNNQIHKNNSFFDLKMNKGQQETLQTVIYNTTNRDIQVATAIHTAYTNSTGTIEYVTPTKTLDQSLVHQMSDITKIEGQKTVTIPANGSKTVSAKVTMPDQQFNGVILGGWFFKRVDSKVTGAVKGSMNIKNQYSYVIGLKYTSGKTPAPTMKLGSVGLGTSNYHKAVMINLRNPTAVMIPNLTTTTTITSKNSGKVVKTGHQKNVQMAPNTFYKYPLLLEKTNLQAGKYHVKIVAKNSEHRWVFEKDFTVTQKDVQKYNRDSVDNNGLNIWWLIGLGALGMLIIVLLILWLVFFIKKRRQQQ